MLDTPAAMAGGRSVVIDIYDFKANAAAGGANVSTANVQKTITFSDGSVVTFNTGAC